MTEHRLSAFACCMLQQQKLQFDKAGQWARHVCLQQGQHMPRCGALLAGHVWQHAAHFYSIWHATLVSCHTHTLLRVWLQETWCCVPCCVSSCRSHFCGVLCGVLSGDCTPVQSVDLGPGSPGHHSGTQQGNLQVHRPGVHR
jgi:hypothetical protein